eukprot:TRINITY_DN6886_c0_g1_i1.p1 TRINITY_DN6886_c0_g1~~TRINITY_DN6886_c0_g1_i1.p1  ORF type:complete len:439 (+),score=68.43 TRINITY_DN6886_c0_g1_i1:184-1500(+)
MFPGKEKEKESSMESYSSSKYSLPLPTCWSTKDRCPILELSNSCLRIAYKGPGKTDTDAATVRANQYIPPSCGIFYYEISIINKGRDGYIGIGVCTGSMNLTRLPGWERNSFGYHGDDGHVFRGSGLGKPYGPTFSTGDTIGCCINFITNTLFYTKNGVRLGEAMSDPNFSKGGSMLMYPCVGLRTPGEIIEANFGLKPFTFDIEEYKKEEKLKCTQNIHSIPIPEGEASSCISLIMSYLNHYGYENTLRVLHRDCGGVESEIDVKIQEIKHRKSICSLICQGQIEKAMKQLNEVYPGFLESQREILFELLCQQFIEMIKSKVPEEDVLIFGTQQLTPFENDGSYYRNTLQEVFALIAYTDPTKGPVSHLLDDSRREPISVSLNCGLLVHNKQLATPALSTVVKHTEILMDEVVLQSAGPQAIFFDVNQIVKGDDDKL